MNDAAKRSRGLPLAGAPEALPDDPPVRVDFVAIQPEEPAAVARGRAIPAPFLRRFPGA